MNRTVRGNMQDASMSALETTLLALNAKKTPLTENERKFVEKMNNIKLLLDRGCENFKLSFQLSEAHWLRSSIKYDESFELYSAIHQSFVQLTEKSRMPFATAAVASVAEKNATGKNGYKTLLS